MRIAHAIASTIGVVVVDWQSPRRARTMPPRTHQPHAMARIDITHAHGLSTAAAKRAVEDIADKLAERFDIQHHWQGQALLFDRPGVNGRITLAAKQVQVQAELGFLLSALKGSIEQEIRRYLDEKFGKD